MKNLSLYFSFLVLIAAIISGCTQKMKQEQDENAAIIEVYEQYLHFVETGDLDSFMTLWDENAMRGAPDLPNTTGKEEIRAIFKNIFDATNNKLTPIEEIRLEVCGNIAYGYRTFTLTSTFKESGTVIQKDMTVLSIFKKQPNGSWKLYIDCMNTHPSWSMDSIPSELKEDNPYY
jgi:ketosteroid isomerase-like protein